MTDPAPCRPRAPRLRAALAERRGGVGEVLFWAAVFCGAIAAIADLSMIYTTTASMWDAARDSARRVALHEATAEEARAAAAGAVALGAPGIYAVEVTEDETDVTVIITADAADASPIGLYAAVAPGRLTARVTMMKEPE